jgi:hypothetical protein
MALGEIGWVVRTGLIWLRIRASGGLSGFHKLLRSSLVAVQLATSREALIYMELVS